MNETSHHVPPLTWTTPSGKALHSVPLGNGDIGVNIWVERPGDVVFYIAKTDAWSEHGRLLKLGRVRLSFGSVNFNPDFHQESISPATATAELKTGSPGSQIRVRTWVDANHPVIRVETTSDQPIHFRATVELWRTEARSLTSDELMHGLEGCPYPLIEGPDTFLPSRNERLVWFHRNESSIWPSTMELQGLAELKKTSRDPLLHRTFGCAMGGKGLKASSHKTLTSSEANTTWSLEVHPYTAVADTVDEWVNGLEAQIDLVNQTRPEDARSRHLDWWNAFWERSWIQLSGSPEAERISEAYRLQRYYIACSGRGKFPIKFNGSISTVDHPPTNPDYRRWGGGYWFQNTRLCYWPMLAAGDFDFMAPLFAMFQSQLDLARFRTRKYFGHEGAYFGETQTFWGTYLDTDFGWDGKAAETGEIRCAYLRWYFTGNLELLALMLGYLDHTQDRAFAEETLLPMARELLEFYDKRHPRDEEGHLKLVPGQSLETYWDTINCTPDIAGLRYILDRLLNLPEELANLAPLAEWRRLRNELPEIPMETRDGKTRILPAAKFDKITNCENPELYAIFPFPIFGVGQPDLAIAQHSYIVRLHKFHAGWSQEEIQAACAGLAREAKEGLVERFSIRGLDKFPLGNEKFLDDVARYPAVWGPNFDWMPDMDHGSSAMIALQSMLLKANGNELHILPAWPADWDVEFKLRAPGGVLVTGSVKKGRLASLEITPENNGLQVIAHQPQ